METEASKGAWVVAHTDNLHELLIQAWSGEDPSLLLLEFLANCSSETVDGA